MKFCSECGSQLPSGTVKFCSNCGTSLWQSGEPKIQPTENEKNITQNSSEALSRGEVEMELPNQTIHSLGIKLEEMVEQILMSRGYATKTRQKLEGTSGAFHEIDILATKDGKLLAVECKNYSEARTVGIKELRDFQSKIEDLSQVGRGHVRNQRKFIIGCSDICKSQ
jgi:Holliday junction resolvase-like predicted endonuclease